MTNSSSALPEASGFSDRRSHHNLRLIFDAACQMTAPFFDVKHGWGGAALSMYARQALRDAYPELTQQEIAILYSGIARFHQDAAKHPQQQELP